MEAITYRETDDARPANSEVFAIKGALPIQSEQMLAPTRDFARPILGIVGQATKEIVDDSDGAVVAGDEVGLSGLQKRYDSTLRGTPGVQVQTAAADIRFLVGVAVTFRLAGRVGHPRLPRAARAAAQVRPPRSRCSRPSR